MIEMGYLVFQDGRGGGIWDLGMRLGNVTTIIPVALEL